MPTLYSYASETYHNRGCMIIPPLSAQTDPHASPPSRSSGSVRTIVMEYTLCNLACHWCVERIETVAHPWYHAVMAAQRYGGVIEDYVWLESWIDYTKSHIADCRHRLFLHNSWGIFVGERIHGTTLTRASDGKVLPIRPLLEDHILQDFGKIPTLAACLAQVPAAPPFGEVVLADHCRASATRYGGQPEDYAPLHRFLDWPRDYLPDGLYQRILHNGWGIALCEEAFGDELRRASDGESVATRAIATDHIAAELGVVPTLESCLEGITVQRWMCTRAMPDPT